ncbi:hypothetical protein PJF56_08855 [Roseofilum sp. BLCC_M91]|uniref:Armadillo-type fold-containing protein n=1 Tax=Roseofilum halophilum BLCC-M91 TaxID=3022259 RepID=A0ABT7BKF3_9CYAN|nr:hypothetical protein [Roseofilum halophilum]MDJ1178971.1 hypothetical protein [Roseofilum halophilum BLCC-M91]
MRKSPFQGSGSWLFFLTLIAVLMAWNWRLVLATSLGITMMVVLYRMQSWDWQRQWAHLRRWVTGPNRQLALAVTGGSGVTLATYMAISVWIEAENGWIAASQILEGLGILAILGLLVGRSLFSQYQQQELELDRVLMDLTHPEPLLRLLAVRRVNRLLYTRYGQKESGMIFDALRLMLSREQEPVVRDALLESLKRMQSPLSMDASAHRPLSIPLNLESKSSTAQPPLKYPQSPQLRRRQSL